MFVNGILVPVNLLTNGTSIVQVKRDRVTYYHVELPEHAVILAEGLTVESYLDVGDRVNFEQCGETIRLFPEFVRRVTPEAALVWETRGVAPLVMTGSGAGTGAAGGDGKCTTTGFSPIGKLMTLTRNMRPYQRSESTLATVALALIRTGEQTVCSASLHSITPGGEQSNEITCISAWLRARSERVWRHQDGATSMRRNQDNSEAFSAFVARKVEIDTILARLTAPSGEHFNTARDGVTWTHVGTLGSYLDGLRRVCDAALHDGEHAH